MSKRARVSVTMVGLSRIVACSSGGSPSKPPAAGGSPTGVVVGNLVEVGGQPGMITASYTATANGQALAPAVFQVPAFPLEGKVVTVVPMLPIAGLTNPTLTYSSGGTTIRAVTILSTPASGSPGSGALPFLHSSQVTGP